MRKTSFENGECYHVYNRGVDKRNIVSEKYDSLRFLRGLAEFNSADPIGSIYENSFNKKQQLGSLASKSEKLVNIICYCLNPNHFHLLLEQVSDRGITKFMQRLGTGYTKYFNEKYSRTGSLFQGVFKAKHVSSNDYLRYLSAYINLNNRVHQMGDRESEMVYSSWDEYLANKGSICKKEIILGQFDSSREYERYCLDTLPLLVEQKTLSRELQELGFEE